MRTVHASAPIRICDIGGWTDTWFAGHGAVFHIAVEPRVEVHVEVHDAANSHRVTLDLPNLDERYAIDLPALPGRHPLLEATLDEVGVPDGCALTITVDSGVPPGISTGTSAAVTVALIGALDAAAGWNRPPDEVASAAHRIETERLQMESGVQDQLCAAFGGINYIEIPAYPEAHVTPIAVPDAVSAELERRLLLVSLGRHVSSDVHRRVIEGLWSGGADRGELERLRQAAARARDAVMAGDLEELGHAMRESTDTQRQLHTELVSTGAQRVIDVAGMCEASGWKVNGAGGEGGSLTVLTGPDPDAPEALIGALRSADPTIELIPIQLSRDGLRTWAG